MREGEVLPSLQGGCCAPTQSPSSLPHFGIRRSTFMISVSVSWPPMPSRASKYRPQIAAAALAAACLMSGAVPDGWHQSARGHAAASLVYGQLATSWLTDRLGALGEWIGAVSDRSKELSDAHSENRLLREQLAIAQSRLLEMDRALHTMQQTLAIKPPDPAPVPKLTAATVVGRDASNWPSIIVLDCGSAQGVEVGSGVICGQAVVGVVSAVRGSACIVRLLTHPQCRVDACIARTGESRHVAGNLTDTIHMLDVHEKPVQPGDVVLTSGELGTFPRGLLIGTVTKAAPAEGALGYSVEVRPAAELSTLHDVLIVQPHRTDALDLLKQQGK